MDKDKKQKPIVSEIYPDIYKIELPLPVKGPGPVNAYLFKGRHISLIDTGTNRTVNILKNALRTINVSFTDIENVIITHGHGDHYGAAKKILELSGSRAKIHAGMEEKDIIESGKSVPLIQYIKFFRLMGVPLLLRITLLIANYLYNSMADNCPIDTLLSEGDKIILGNYEAEVIDTPGHSKGAISLLLKKEGILFPGDHILSHITPNAFVMLDNDFDLPLRMSQVEFYDSLAKIEKIAPDRVFPAHGDPITDIENVISVFRNQFNRRQKKIRAILGKGRQSAYTISRLLFPNIKGAMLLMETFLIVSEVYTHLQVLEKNGDVVSAIKNGIVYFSLHSPEYVPAV